MCNTSCKSNLNQSWSKQISYIKLTRDQIAERVAQDIPEGAYVNLGIGLPTRIASYLPTDKEVLLHSENGLLAFGPSPEPGEEDPELINAGKEFVTMLNRRCLFPPWRLLCHDARWSLGYLCAWRVSGCSEW